MELDVITTANPRAWTGALERSGWHDFYHECWYHQLAEQAGEGTGQLLVISHAGRTFTLPVLLRPIAGARGRTGAPLHDATSVYGYAGPTGVFDGVDDDAWAVMSAAIREHLVTTDTVSLFARLHPLRDQQSLFAGAGQIVDVGTTVSVDLTTPDAQQWREYRADNRNRISRLRREGYVCEARGPGDLETFIELYEATMRRVSAKAYYVFPRDYYAALVDRARGGLEIFVVTDGEGTPAAAGLFSFRGDVVQYHLSGAGEGYRKQAPTTLLLDTVRRVAIARGARHLHLGGGLGGAEDSLFAFKAGFGGGRHRFRVVQWILDPEAYRELAARRAGRGPAPVGFFPGYRAP